MKKVFLFILGAVLSLLFFELYLRYARITPPVLKFFNNEFGSLNRTNIRYMKSVEGYFVGNTNYAGRFRENFSPLKNSKEILRILLIGDSFVEGIDVLSANHFAARLESELASKFNRKVEILNFGRGNCTLYASSYYYINHIVKEYDADMVLYFTEQRDIIGQDNYPSTTFSLDSNNSLKPDFSWRNRFDYKIDLKLKSLGFLSYYEKSVYSSLIYRAFAGKNMYTLLSTTFGKFVGELPEQDYNPKNSEFSISNLSEAIYDTLPKANPNSKFIYVVRNFPVNSDQLVSYLNEKKYNMIDLSDTLNSFYIKGTNTNVYYFKATNTYGGHWNHEGHKVVATFLANRIFRTFSNYRLNSISDEK
jgi:hypothetical protein